MKSCLLTEHFYSWIEDEQYTHSFYNQNSLEGYAKDILLTCYQIFNRPSSLIAIFGCCRLLRETMNVQQRRTFMLNHKPMLRQCSILDTCMSMVKDFLWIFIWQNGIMIKPLRLTLQQSCPLLWHLRACGYERTMLTASW